MSSSGVTFPEQAHDLDGKLSIQVLEGDILISKIREPHDVKATSKMRILITIASPPQ